VKRSEFSKNIKRKKYKARMRKREYTKESNEKD